MRHATVIWVLDDSIVLVRPTTDSSVSTNTRLALPESIRKLETFTVEQIIQRIEQESLPANVSTGVTLVLPARWAYAHVIVTPGRRISNQAVAFALEEYLPSSAEELVCSAHPIDRQKSLGIGLPQAPLHHLIDGLASVGVRVERITLDVLAAAKAPSDEQAAGVLIKDSSSIAMALVNGSARIPIRIRSAINEDQNLDSCWLERQSMLLGSEDETGPTVWHCFDVTRDEELCELNHLCIDRENDVALNTNGLVADSVTSRLWNRLAATGILAAAACILLLVHGHRTRTDLTNRADTIATRQAEIFSEVVPLAAVPSNPAMRLASERLRLERITGSSPQSALDELGPTDPLAPLTQLSKFVGGLPESVRINIVEGAIDDRQFSLRGQTRDHRSAEQIAETINKHTIWEARPPRTSRLPDGGVEFSLRATEKSTNLASTRAMK